MIYRTHVKFNFFIALPLLLFIVFYLFNPLIPNALSFTVCFIYATLYMNPDLDLAYKIKLFSLKGLLTIPFRSYSLIFKHRGISHSPILGTLSRVLWLMIFFIFFLFIFDKLIFLQKPLVIFYKTYKHLIFSGFWGILAADICHLILDSRIFK